MMNLSSLSKIILLSIVGIGVAAATLWLVYSGAPMQTVLLTASIQVPLVLLIVFYALRVRKFIRDTGRVCDAVRMGDFDQRIVLPRARGDIARTANRINSMIDINDAFVREASLALKAAAEGRFYRKIRTEGMLGMFAHSVDRINESIDMMAKAASCRADLIEALSKEISGTIEAAINGDFTKRMQVSRAGDEFSAIGRQVNDLVGVVNRGLSETGEVLGALARADLSHRVEGNYRGAFDKLKNDTNAVADKMCEIMGQLRATSSALKTATGEILEGANDLSERTTKQAATVEETSASVEQLSNTVMQSAQQADDASAKSRALAKTAEETGHVVSRATDAMARITASSEKISNVIGMIDDIAFQTNLLALNASVEAARAGEAGKGFAVVAVEVRRLAQSAAEASTEVKNLIEQSANEVGLGSKFVTEAAEKLNGMIASIQENASVMHAIASVSREQAASIDEVNVAVRQMDEMTQHNAALVEQTNAAIEQTDSQVVELDNIVEVFKISATPEELEARRKAREKPRVKHNRRASDRVGQQETVSPARENRDAPRSADNGNSDADVRAPAVPLEQRWA